MIILGKETIHRYKELIEWMDTLRDLDDNTWLTPIAEGKATAAEIVSHLKNWDHYLINTIIPSIKNGEGMVFPEFDSFNQKAYEYARSGISKNHLLDEFKQTRLELIEVLLSNPDIATKHVAVNGVVNCPHTDTPYSLLYIIHEFIEHDLHHKNQILSVI
ncbi:DinB family protein [Paenibacillus sp. NEAU-GSW1]|uniref:DinB family protein n=1 Tax=Paenibacillus sp. NEAU-GSW1 TaxID=2682486 RepID=UPI0012E13A7E|nr:DinB family protein [Paenibacillus sp. NEAU-GSW1]MUT67275.1 DinB family protein [Paenibacillus sp. NEAU-GSW1]